MFNEKILKVAKRILDKKNLKWITGSMHYNIEKNLLSITDSFILAEIQMPEKYKEMFKDLGVNEVIIDYYTACWLLGMIENADALREFSTISLWNATVQDYIEYEYIDLKSNRHWIKVRLPIIEADKMPAYKEESLFWTWEDSTKQIAITRSFEKFQDVCNLLCDSDMPVIKVWDQTYIAEWKFEYMMSEDLSIKICVRRVKDL